MIDKQTIIIQTWEFDTYFLESEQSKLTLEGKQLTVFVATDKI